MTLTKSTPTLLTLTGSAQDLLPYNPYRNEAVVQNKGANPVAVHECKTDVDVASLAGNGIILTQNQRHVVQGTNRVSVIGTAADVVYAIES